MKSILMELDMPSNEMKKFKSWIKSYFPNGEVISFNKIIPRDINSDKDLIPCNHTCYLDKENDDKIQICMKLFAIKFITDNITNEFTKNKINNINDFKNALKDSLETNLTMLSPIINMSDEMKKYLNNYQDKRLKIYFDDLDTLIFKPKIDILESLKNIKSVLLSVLDSRIKDQKIKYVFYGGFLTEKEMELCKEKMCPELLNDRFWSIEKTNWYEKINSVSDISFDDLCSIGYNYIKQLSKENKLYDYSRIEWNLKNWGCVWDAIDSKWIDDRRLIFKTIDEVPINIFNKIKKEFPKLKSIIFTMDCELLENIFENNKIQYMFKCNEDDEKFRTYQIPYTSLLPIATYLKQIEDNKVDIVSMDIIEKDINEINDKKEVNNMKNTNYNKTDAYNDLQKETENTKMKKKINSNDKNIDFVELNKYGINKNLIEFSIEYINRNEDLYPAVLYWDYVNLYLIDFSDHLIKPFRIVEKEIVLQPGIVLKIGSLNDFLNPSSYLLNMKDVMNEEKEIAPYKEKLKNIIKDFDGEKLELLSFNVAILYKELYHKSINGYNFYGQLELANKYLDQLADELCKQFPGKNKNIITEKVFKLSPFNLLFSSNNELKLNIISEIGIHFDKLTLLEKTKNYYCFNPAANSIISNSITKIKDDYIFAIRLIVFKYIISIVENNK